MRTDSNRLLVGNASQDDQGALQPVNRYTRRHLAEVIIALLIIFLCIYIFVPVFMGTAESAHRVICVTHLRRLAQAMEMYQMDCDGQYPPTGVWVHAMYPYVLRPAGEEESEQPRRRLRRPRLAPELARRGLPDGAEVFLCPSEENLPRRRNAPSGANASSYSYRQPPPIGVQTVPFGWDYLGGTGQGAHPNGGNVVYLDGRVTWLPANRWATGDQP